MSRKVHPRRLRAHIDGRRRRKGPHRRPGSDGTAAAVGDAAMPTIATVHFGAGIRHRRGANLAAATQIDGFGQED